MGPRAGAARCAGWAPGRPPAVATDLLGVPQPDEVRGDPLSEMVLEVAGGSCASRCAMVKGGTTPNRPAKPGGLRSGERAIRQRRGRDVQRAALLALVGEVERDALL